MTNLQTVGGNLSPTNIQICKGQNMSASLALSGYSGSILNWQSSQDSVHWNDFVPAKTDSIYNINGVSVPTQYRTIVKNGTCPADTSNEAFVGLYNAQFPQASVHPADTAICLGSKAFLNADITIGTNYTWSNAGSIFNAGNGTISSVPFTIHAQSAPSKNTDYILTITNVSCPNKYTDTIHVKVLPAFSVNAGRDTFVVANQPLQLMATVSIVEANMNYLWTPATGLNNQIIANPVSILSAGTDSIRYFVKATDSIGCSATDNILVRVFNSGPEIFVPSAFTPNGDGKNDIIRPITVGILQLNFFSIYNRWGQMLYRTSEIGKGWDGIANGNQQPSGTYVYTAEGIDYLGHVLFRKGTVVLIR
jgi:gliding motility-associated-like protein